MRAFLLSVCVVGKKTFKRCMKVFAARDAARRKGGRVEVVDAALGAAATLREEGALSPEPGQGCEGAAFFRTALFAPAAASVFA